MEFGALKTLSDLDIEVKEKEIVSVIGPNGAGKTTLFNIVTGLYRPTSGTVLLGDQEMTGLSPAQINHAGIARTFQNVRDRKSTRLNSSHIPLSRMPSSA